MSSEPEVIEAETVGEEKHLTVIREQQALTPVEPAQDGGAVVTINPFVGVAANPFDERAQTILTKYQTVPDEWIDIKPDGKVYLSNMRARAIFNEAFGFGGWGIVPVEGSGYVERKPFKDKYGKEAEHVTIYREYRLYVNGRFVRQAMGSGDYYTNNREADYSDAVEASESYALNRFAKFFCIASQCWDHNYAEAWKKQYGYKDGDKWKKRPLGVSVPPPQKDAGSRPAPNSTQTTQPAPQPAKTTAPASDPSATEGVQEGTVGRIATIKGGHRVEVGGQGFSIFSTTDLDLLTKAQAAGAAVRVNWKLSKDGKWRNVVSIEEV